MTPSHEALADHLKTLNASTQCPVCGHTGMHEHTPTELIIYRNGVKYGRSLYETRVRGVPRVGQCEATVPAKWHTPEHRCEFEATTEINGQKLCGHHLTDTGEPLDVVSGNVYCTSHGKDESGTAPGTAREAREDGSEAV